MKFLVLLGHIGVVLVFSVLLDKAGLSRKKSMFFGFVLVGLLFGLIVTAIDTYETSMMVNPLGTWAGNWLYNNWDPALHDTTIDRELSIPWLFRPPQVYAFMSIVMYSAIGSLTWFGVYTSKLDPHSYIGRNLDADEPESETDTEDEADSDPQVEASLE